MNILLRDGGHLHYAVYGEEHETNGTIVMIHGLTGNRHQLAKYRKAFQTQYEVIAIDLRGRGDSSAQTEDSGIPTHVDDVLELLDQLQLTNVTLFGYSMGAYISQAVATKTDRVQHVILLDGGGHVDEEGKALVYPSLGRMNNQYDTCEPYVEETTTIYKNLKVAIDEDVLEAVRYECRPKEGAFGNVANPEKIKQDFDSFYDYDVAHYVEVNDKPTYLITGEGPLGERPLFTKDNYRIFQEQSNVTVFETDQNHYELAFNRQQEIIERLTNFLKGEL